MGILPSPHKSRVILDATADVIPQENQITILLMALTQIK